MPLATSSASIGDSAADAGAAMRATNAIAHNRADPRSPIMAMQPGTTRMRAEKYSHQGKSPGLHIFIQPLLGEIMNAVQAIQESRYDRLGRPGLGR